jgi:hypothetical protein
MAKMVLSYVDHSEEPCTSSFTGADLTAANFDAQIALQDALKTALFGIVLHQPYKDTRVAYQTLASKDPPADSDAQRERKWVISYEDTVTFERYTVEVPMADLTLLDGNTDQADLDNATVAAFVTAFEAYQLSPNGNAVEIKKITHVGRRL